MVSTSTRASSAALSKGTMSTSAAHDSHHTRADVACRMTRCRSVSIVMRTVFFVAKLGSLLSSRGLFRATFLVTFWLTL